MTAFLPLSVGETPSDLGWCHHTIRYRQRIAGASPCCWPGGPSDPDHALDLPRPATPRWPPARFTAWPHDGSARYGRIDHPGETRATPPPYPSGRSIGGVSTSPGRGDD